ncbi:MAG TPA: iron-containing alcohol dehydrogenase, partial [Candidatus Limnocylindrales bacterium]|nr:iron-containing alcohol dehydrogenase [Candidatus Limnocylindrales bacterium]
MLELSIRDRTRFGPGAVETLGSLVREAGADRAFVVTDAGVVGSGVIDRVAGVLDAAGIASTIFDGV